MPAVKSLVFATAAAACAVQSLAQEAGPTQPPL